MITGHKFIYIGQFKLKIICYQITTADFKAVAVEKIDPFGFCLRF